MLNGLSACETALALLERDLWPIALYPPGIMLPGRDRPTRGKEPIGDGWGCKLPTADELRAIYRSHPAAGVGIRLGIKGRVIDLEVDGPDGQASLRELLGGEPETLGWSSRRGPHHLFEFPSPFLLRRFKSKRPEFPGLEFRIPGFEAQVQSACPPSLGEDGEPRRWNGRDEVAKLPDAAIGRLLALASGPAPTRPSGGAGARPAPGPGNTTPYGDKSLSDECDLVAGAAEGDRHVVLNGAAMRIASLAKAGKLSWEDGRR